MTRTGLTFLMAMLLMASVAQADTEILVGNAGFERLSADGTVLEWGVDSDTPDATAAVAATAEVMHSGVGSLVVTHDGPASTTVYSLSLIHI